MGSISHFCTTWRSTRISSDQAEQASARPAGRRKVEHYSRGERRPTADRFLGGLSASRPCDSIGRVGESIDTAARFPQLAQNHLLHFDFSVFSACSRFVEGTTQRQTLTRPKESYCNKVVDSLALPSGRSQSQTCSGCTVSCTTASTCSCSCRRSTCWRNVSLKASSIFWASYLRR
jgi:hypothetical protein